MSTLPLVLEVVGLVAQLGLVAMPVALVVLCHSGRSVRVVRSAERVVLTAVDGYATLVALAWLGVVGVGAALWSRAGGAHSPGALVMLSGLALSGLTFRVRLVVTTHAARLERRVLGVIRWRCVPITRPTAYVDGWGDFADPLAFIVADEGGEVSVEIGFIDATNERTEPLAERFREAVRALRAPPASPLSDP